MAQEKEYYAFISYKREDKKEAKRLQHALEYYRLPNHLRQENPELPEYVRPVFRDMTDLEVGELSAQIHSGLEQSHFLIVVCSPRAAMSKWVNDEVEYFISLGRQDKIIPFIIEGFPHASNPNEECYPPALLNLSKEKELLGANINEVGKDSATIRVVSRMFNIRFDTLYQRYQRDQKKRRLQLTTSIVLAFLFLLGIAGWIWHQNILLKEREWKMMENQAKAVAEKAMDIAYDEDSYLARLLALEVLPKDLCYPNRPYTKEVDEALRVAECSSNAILKGHTNTILSASFSPSGKQIVSSTKDKIIIWDAKTGQIINEINGTNAVFSPDGKTIIYTIPDDTICIWDIDKAKRSRFYYCPNSAYDVAISPDGLKIAVSSKNLSLIDLNKGDIIWTIDGIKHSLFEMYGTPIDGLSFSSDGKYLVSVGKMTKIWDVGKGVCINTINEESDYYSASMSPNSKHIVFPSGSRVKICDIITNKCLMVTDSILYPRESNFSNVKFEAYLKYSPKGDRFVLVSGDELSIWNIKGVCVNRKKNKNNTYFNSFAAFSPDGQKILFSEGEGTLLKIWDISDEHLLPQKVIETREWPQMADFNLIGNQILTVYDGFLELWDEEMRVSKIISGEYTKSINYASFSPDDKTIVITSKDDILRIIDAQTGVCMQTIRIGGGWGETSVSYNPLGNQLMSISSSDTAKIWSTTTYKCVHSIPDVSMACYSPTGKHLVTLHENGLFRVWDTKTWNCCATSEKGKHLSLLTISQSGRKILSYTSNGVFDIWEVCTGKHLKTIRAEITEESCWGRILALFLSPDEKQIVAFSELPIGVWDVETGKCINTMRDRFAPGNHFAAFSNDGRKAIAVGDGSFVRLWRYPNLQQLINETYDILNGRELSPEERKQYYLE